MQGHGWQTQKKISVPGSGTATVALPPSRPVLQQFSVWASSGDRVLTNMTFQVRINGKNFGTSVNVTGAKAADIVLAMNGATRDQALLPNFPAGGDYDRFDVDVLLTNAHTSAELVTVIFAGIGRDGGGR